MKISLFFIILMSKRELKELGPALPYGPMYRGPTTTAIVSKGPQAPRRQPQDDASNNKRPKRAAATAAINALDGAHITVAELNGVHASQSIALTSFDALQAMTWPENTVVLTLHTNERPSCLPAGVMHIGAAFDDCADFEDVTMTKHLDKMGAYLWAADAARIVFVCHAGINRSSLALCYYLNKYGTVSWRQARDALVTAKRGAASGWPTLENASFVAYLSRRFANDVAAAGAPQPHWFWRTVATARPSTGGPDHGPGDPEEALRRRRELDEGMRRQGIDPRSGRTWGCWDRGRRGGVWVRGVPGKPRPWDVIADR